MRIAVFSDVHGNLPAFEAVVRDMESEHIDMKVFLGDLVLNGLFPSECFFLLEQLQPEIILSGNTDQLFTHFASNAPDGSAREQKAYSLYSYAKQRMKFKQTAKLTSWDHYQQRTIDGRSVGFCHGTPFDSSKRLITDELSKLIHRKIERLGHDLLLHGHTHMQADFDLGRTLCVNFGAVGYSFDGDSLAHYGIVEIDQMHILPIPRHVEYDVEAYRDAVEASFLPYRQELSYILEHGLPMT